MHKLQRRLLRRGVRVETFRLVLVEVICNTFANRFVQMRLMMEFMANTTIE